MQVDGVEQCASCYGNHWLGASLNWVVHRKNVSSVLNFGNLKQKGAGNSLVVSAKVVFYS
jgi:hypothetical protein